MFGALIFPYVSASLVVLVRAFHFPVTFHHRGNRLVDYYIDLKNFVQFATIDISSLLRVAPPIVDVISAITFPPVDRRALSTLLLVFSAR